MVARAASARWTGNRCCGCPENPALLRAIRGEVRVLDSRSFLARMNWQTATGFATVLYFTLRQD